MRWLAINESQPSAHSLRSACHSARKFDSCSWRRLIVLSSIEFFCTSSSMWAFCEAIMASCGAEVGVEGNNRGRKDMVVCAFTRGKGQTRSHFDEYLS